MQRTFYSSNVMSPDSSISEIQSLSVVVTTLGTRKNGHNIQIRPKAISSLCVNAENMRAQYSQYTILSQDTSHNT